MARWIPSGLLGLACLGRLPILLRRLLPVVPWVLLDPETLSVLGPQLPSAPLDPSVRSGPAVRRDPWAQSRPRLLDQSPLWAPSSLLDLVLRIRLSHLKGR